jgi:hypothetical protein
MYLIQAYGFTEKWEGREAGRVAQVVECLLSKHEALSTTKKKKQVAGPAVSELPLVMGGRGRHW